ncbi:hypothetical protein ES707_20317 [subsurface metagenome]
MSKGLVYAILSILLVWAIISCAPPGANTSATASPRLVIKAAPGGISTVNVTVSADDLPEILLEYASPPSSIVIELPAGPARRFDVEVGVDNQTVASKYSGSATVDLVPGDSKEVGVEMSLSETKLIIPDGNNYRLVQIDNMSGAGWTTLSGTQLGYAIGEHMPWDADFDDRGRIYVANYHFSSGGVYRIDGITDTSRETISNVVSISTVAVDRENGYVYYYSGDTDLIYRRKLDPLGPEESFDPLAEPSISTFGTTGIEVGPNGKLFLANSSGNQIIKYDPDALQGSRVQAVYTTTNLIDPHDVLVRDSYVYAANWGGLDGYKIIRLDQNLGNAVGYGNDGTGSEPTPPGDFWKPTRFIAVISRKILLADEDTVNNYDRLVAFDDINGFGWQVYGTNGSGVGQFQFYC